VLAIWSLFFLGMLAIAIHAAVWPQVNFASYFVQRVKANYLARAGVKSAILEIKRDKTADVDSMEDNWSQNDVVFKDAVVGDGSTSVVRRLPSEDSEPDVGGTSTILYGLTDEESKVNINQAPRDVLKRLFEKTGGLNPDDAQGLADCVVDWRDKDDIASSDGAENDYYSSLDRRYHCKNADFETSRELLLVKGMSPELFEKLKNYITVYTEGKVNINTAGHVVLESLGMNEGLADKIVRYRRGAGRSFQDAGSISQVLNQAEKLSGTDTAELNKVLPLLDVRSDNFRGEVEGRLKNRADSSSIIFVYNRVEKKIKYWVEE